MKRVILIAMAALMTISCVKTAKEEKVIQHISKHNITLEITPEKNFIKGTDHIFFNTPLTEPITLYLIKDVKVTSLTSDQEELNSEITIDSVYQNIKIIPNKNYDISSLSIAYEGTLNYSPNERALNETHSNSLGIISDKEGEGIYLPAGSFYPYGEDDMADFKVDITFPEHLEMITSGKLEKIEAPEGQKEYLFSTELTVDNITLIGGRYTVTDSLYNGVNFSVLSLPKSNSGMPPAMMKRMGGGGDSSEKYLQASIEYYKQYSELFGDYPYSKFVIVENFFATGFGMPGYTLLSNQLMAMSWIVLSPGALAHEFVHNWWGNSVFVDYEKGNWCEALTVFSTNYYYHILTGNDEKALNYRKSALLSLSDLPAEKNYPLIKFKYQENSDDAVIGYEKGAMLFNEVYKLMGKDDFFKALQLFNRNFSGKVALWEDIIATFENYSKSKDLNFPVRKVFKQWLYETKLPTISLDKTKVTVNEDQLTFTINQDLEYYAQVPVKITTDKETKIIPVIIDKKNTEATCEIDGKLISIELDPQYNVLRELNPFEKPYTFNKTLSDDITVILPNKDDKKVAEEFVGLLKQSGYNVNSTSCDDLESINWKERSIIVIGSAKSNSFIDKYLKDSYPEIIKSITADKLVLNREEKNEFSLESNLLMANFSHPENADRSAALITYEKLGDVKQLRRLFHYMGNSLLLLKQSKMGRPLLNLEIFPAVPKDNPMKYVVEK